MYKKKGEKTMGLDHGIIVKNKDISIDWRKCNQIRGWFSRLENFEDNGETPISIDILEDLLTDLRLVAKDHSKAPELLPVQRGFFFGSYEYDDWYFDDVEDAIKQITDFLLNVDEDDEIIYWEWY